MSRYSRELTVGAALLVLLLLLAVFAPHFFQPQPLISRLTSQMPALVAAIGVALVIMTRQIDISVGAQFSMCAVVAGVAAAAGAHSRSLTVTRLGSAAISASVNGSRIHWPAA